jgi:P27 family predicted phage terminase small subunit
MAGNKRSGRNPKPRLFAAGSDGPSVVVPGAVVVPAELDGEALRVWKGIVGPLAERGIVTAGDVPAAQAMCEFWALYRLALVQAKIDPLDKNARCAVKAYSSEFDRLASRFGLTPSDRQRLKAPTNEQPAKLSKFTAK